jgi:hypothetical protein
LTAFRDAATGELQALDAADEAALTMQELEQMRHALAAAKTAAEADANKAVAAREELACLRGLLSDAVPAARAAEAELNAAIAAIEDELAPVKSLCAALGVSDALTRLRYLSSKP